MVTITEIKDRTTCSCTGMSLAAFDVRVTDGQTTHEYRIREFAYHAVWQLEQLKDGPTGMTEDDYIDRGEFPTKDAALAHLHSLTPP